MRHLLPLACAALLALSACVEMELPSSEDVEQLFVSHGHDPRLHDPVPEGIPVLDSEELGGWRTLCDQCHIGPHYSSYTILTWAHKTECETQTTCLNCHGEKLHRSDVRGSKQVCFECHMERELTTSCDDCHVEGWRQTHTPAGHSMTGHGAWALEDATHCASCHGTQSWCVDCHGIQMPHPDTILADHPSLVRGEPQTCANCHGSTPCESCHTDRGVVFDIR